MCRFGGQEDLSLSSRHGTFYLCNSGHSMFLNITFLICVMETVVRYAYVKYLGTKLAGALCKRDN